MTDNQIRKRLLAIRRLIPGAELIWDEESFDEVVDDSHPLGAGREYRLELKMTFWKTLEWQPVIPGTVMRLAKNYRHAYLVYQGK